MARATEFRRALDALFERRTHWLRNLFGRRRPGAPPKFSRKHIQAAVRKLHDLASDALAGDLAREEFDSQVLHRKSWHAKKGKGWGRAAKRVAFNDWFDNWFGPGPTIYVFWRARRCLYVGKTRGNGRRVSSHFEKHWFSGVTRIDVYSVKRAPSLTALECMAIHRFQPVQNRFKAERRKWTRKCPLCEVHKEIELDIRGLFRLRG